MAFATATELGTYLGRTLTTDETSRATALLGYASAAIKGYCRQTLEQVSADSAVLVGNWGSVLVLPERPVTAITSVTITSTSLTVNSDYVWDGGDRLYRGSREFVYGDEPDPIVMRHELHWGGPSAQVTVVYTHGWASGDAHLDVPKGICLEMAARAMHTTPGVKQESIGQYSYTSDNPGASAVTLTTDMRRQLRDAGLRR